MIADEFNSRIAPKYPVIRDQSLDFADQVYGDLYPNLHKYPATMLPQIGIALLKRLGIREGNLLDPYCGSGSSFTAALEVGITEMFGFDMNPLAVLICQAKFTKVAVEELKDTELQLQKAVLEFAQDDSDLAGLKLPAITNMEYWFSKKVFNKLSILRHFIYRLDNPKIRNFLLVPYSETIRQCSYARNNEFKLYRIKSEELLVFDPNVFDIFFEKLKAAIAIYSNFYLPKLKDNTYIEIQRSQFQDKNRQFNNVLTSPPYGDSRTTVAYGQFSTLANEWMGVDYARKIDGYLMGGKKAKSLYTEGIIRDFILQIYQQDKNRALDVSAFYFDLESSIAAIAKSLKKGGKTIYLVGNRTVKGVQLPTDQFIAEQLEKYGCKHLITYERALSSKVMPSQNSPTNQKGLKVNTMLFEYVIINEKVSK